MSVQWRAELEMAVAMGLVAEEDSDALYQRAKARSQSPAELLAAMGLLSQETLGDLRARLSVSEGVMDAVARQAAFPSSLDRRYERKRLLGSGGMGQVHLAWDCRLNRHVAIKVFHRQDPDTAGRLLREARAQGHVRHDRICKVFDAAEADGLAYIVMEYIDGRPLSEIGRELPPAALADIVRQVAEAVEEAHQAGLIHRDIKPSNIMVRQDEGGHAAYILDFGLAYEWSRGDLTQAEAGTPWFMAPEQAQGKTGCLDPRTDVYGLGATLYWCLTGRPPVGGANALEALANIPTEAPRPPSAFNRRTPRDLECIALECLKKRRAERYPSARDLAEDLARFGRGAAVTARGADPLYRLQCLVRRHKALSAALATIVLAALALAVTRYTLQRAADRRAERVLALTRLSEEIESQARYLAMAPAHDIRAGRAAIEERLDRLREEASGARDGDAAGDYALGRGYLALGRYDLARLRLDRAWASGFRDQSCAYARARTLGALYQRELSTLAAVGDAAMADRLRREAERELRDPALALLAQVEGDGARFPWFVEALIAYYESRYEDALAILDRSADQAPWFYEADILRGDIFGALLSSSQSLAAESVEAHYQTGREAYRAAARGGQSDPAPRLAEARLHYLALRRAMLDGAPIEPYFEAGMAPLEAALRIDPGHFEAHVQQARFFKAMAEDLRNRGQDPGEALAQAVAAAKRATALEPERAEGLLTMAALHLQQAFYLRERSEDPAASLERAAALLDRMPAEGRDARFFLNLGLAHKVKADYQAQRGGDALADREAAAAAYRRAIELGGDQPGVHINLGLELFQLAGLRDGSARERGLAEALAAMQDAHRRNPEHVLPHFYLAQCHHGLGKLIANGGGDPGLHFAQALAWFGRAAAINDRVPNFFQGQAVVWLDWARRGYFAGSEIEAAGAQVEAACERALALNPNDGLSHLTLAVWRLLEGHERLRRGEDAETSWREGRAAAAKALALLPSLPQALVSAAEIELGAAAGALAQGRDPAEALGAADALLARARGVNPYADFLYFAEGVYQTLRARSGLEAAAAFDRADCAFRRTLALDPERLEYRLAYADSLWFRAAWLRERGEPYKTCLAQAQVEAGAVMAAAARSDEADALWTLTALCAGENAKAGGAALSAFPLLADRLSSWVDGAKD